MVTVTADLGIAIVCNNSTDNYLWVRNSHATDAADITISGITYNGSPIASADIHIAGGTMTVDKTYEASSSDQTQECTFPEGLGNPKRIDYNLTVVHGVKDPDNWFNKKTKTVEAENTFEVVPVPGEITTDFHQFDKQAVLAWTTPSGGNYMRVTPYVYRIETDEAGSPKSGSSWNKRGTVSSTTGVRCSRAMRAASCMTAGICTCPSTTAAVRRIPSFSTMITKSYVRGRTSFRAAEYGRTN